MTTETRSGIGRLFGVAFETQTYRNLAYLFAGFPLGVLYFTVLVTGGSVGVGLLPILVGIPVLLGVLWLVGYLGGVEAALARNLLGVDIEYVRSQPTGESLAEYAKALTFDARNYRVAAYLFSKFVIGIVSFTLFVSMAATAAALSLAPVLYDLPGVDYQFGVYQVESLPIALALSVLGILLAFGTLHAFNLLAEVHGRYTEAMLGGGRSDIEAPE